MKCAFILDKEIKDIAIVQEAIKASKFEISEVVTCGVRGCDQIPIRWAKANNIPFSVYEPNWDDVSAPDALIKKGKYGPYNAKAGFIRNQVLANYIGQDGCGIAIQSSSSSKTSDCIDKIVEAGGKVFVYPQRIYLVNKYAYEF